MLCSKTQKTTFRRQQSQQNAQNADKHSKHNEQHERCLTLFRARLRTGSAWGDWALYTASPLRAFAGHQGYRRRSDVTRNFFGGDSPSYAGSFDPATQLGVQEPLGFWDPLGLSADKDEATFKRRRAVEIKHGRISMYACMGYIAPEYYKFPGFLSPSLGLEFKDVPNGLAALSKVPVLLPLA